MKELIKAIADAKKEIGKISKDSKNPFFKSKYFDINQLLEHVEGVLQSHNLVVLQPIRDNKVYSEIYHVDTGDYISSSIELPSLTDPQKLGSAITYYRRYTLQSLLSLQAEDDDANKASGNTTNKPQLKDKTDAYNKVVSALQSGNYSVSDVKKKYTLSKAMEGTLKTYEKFANCDATESDIY